MDNSAGVREAVASLIGRGAEAIWVGGDVTVLASIESVIGPARSAGIPVFSNIPGLRFAWDLVRPGRRLLSGRRQASASWPAGFWAESPPRRSPILYEVPAELWIEPGRASDSQGRMVVPEGDRGQGGRRDRTARARSPPAARGVRQGGRHDPPARRACGRSD